MRALNTLRPRATDTGAFRRACAGKAGSGSLVNVVK